MPPFLASLNTTMFLRLPCCCVLTVFLLLHKCRTIEQILRALTIIVIILLCRSNLACVTVTPMGNANTDGGKYAGSTYDLEGKVQFSLNKKDKH